ncbi:LRR receptor-like serine/threonine-protein kinase GSO2, partial [Herrania umbratica]|uniref:LRR receptor-like serine/threonine-protein kinase GSO2 n=1 Tax=Herrania umbratica TaxID=108875 RepID=A0A6J0ZLJ0_9ROSI
MLSKLKNLETLDLRGNILGNDILSHLNGFTSLKSLRLQECGLQGTIPMLEFSHLMNLKELYLGRNEIESFGSFQEKGQLRFIKLEVLGLSGNLFNSSIFSFLGVLSNLKSLHIGSNKLKGSINIKELNALSNLEELYIRDNEVNDFVPPQDNETEFRLTKLEVLDLTGNLFTNSILSSLGRLSNLKSLYIQRNKLKGAINIKDNETELRLINLEVLDLIGNLFSNSIMSSLGRLSNMKSIRFGGNNLKGFINITELDALSNLEE